MFEALMSGGGHAHDHGHNHAHGHDHAHNHSHASHNDVEIVVENGDRGKTNSAYVISDHSLDKKKTLSAKKPLAKNPVSTTDEKEKSFGAYLKGVRMNGWVAFFGDNMHKVADGIAIAAGDF
jgi:zinc transporter ZupT